jgi:hypothetical protein
MRTLTLVTAVLLTTAAPAQRPGDPSPEPPPEGPVTARLIAKQTTYILDRQGMTAAQYAAAAKAGKLKPPDVDLALELKNTTKETIELRVSGSVPKLKLTLKGKGVVEEKARREGRAPVTYVTLRAGEKYELPLKSLVGYTVSASETQLFWTEPGEYTLQAEFTTVTRTPVPVAAAGAALGGGGRARLTNKLPPIVADPIRLTVKLK